MTAEQFKNARMSLGLTLDECAKALGLKTSRAIRQFESGERQVSGPVAKLMGMLLENSAVLGVNGTQERILAAVIDCYEEAYRAGADMALKHSPPPPAIGENDE